MGSFHSKQEKWGTGIMGYAAIIVLLAAPLLIEAGQRCQPDSHGVRRYNGRPCASTTRYNDGHRGSCGCGPRNSDTPFPWNMQEFVTAPSQKYFDRGGDATWCGRNCGKCVKLTPTGGYVDGQGGPPPDHNSRIFMVTNDCPIQGNEYWCGINGPPGSNQVSRNGYEVHFDLQNNHGQMQNIGWNNPEVTWEEVGCPGHLQNHYNECECPRK